MLNTLGDIKNDILVKLNQSTTTGYYSDSIVGTWINMAQSWASGYKKWPVTEGRVSTTYASLTTNEDGYLTGVYPEGFRPDSIRRLTVGGHKVSKKEFFSFTQFLEDNTNNTNRIYTNYGNLYYINPKIDVNGTVTAWGQYIPAALDLTDPNSLTCFSGAWDDANEAIVEEVLSYAKRREEKFPEAEKHHQKAITILESLWNRYMEEQPEYETADNDGMFARFDVLNGEPFEGYRENRFF